MAANRFAYREEGNPPVLRPTVDVRLFCAPHGEWVCRALIDTAAPVTVFDRGAADALGVRIGHAGAETRTTGLMGKTLRLQFETIELSLPQSPDAAWEARVGFITDPTFQMPFQGLLGTEGFLDRWAVTFNKYYEYFEVQPPDEVNER